MKQRFSSLDVKVLICILSMLGVRLLIHIGHRTWALEYPRDSASVQHLWPVLQNIPREVCQAKSQRANHYRLWLPVPFNRILSRYCRSALSFCCTAEKVLKDETGHVDFPSRHRPDNRIPIQWWPIQVIFGVLRWRKHNTYRSRAKYLNFTADRLGKGRGSRGAAGRTEIFSWEPTKF